jgi:hypothetical protein
VLTLASALLSVVSLMLIISPASPTSVLGVAGGFASFLIALGSIYERRRTTALRRLHEEIEGLTERTGRLEAGEQRRMLLELTTRKISPKPQGGEHIQTGG